MFFSIDRNTELARAVDVMMARAKRIYIFMFKVDKLFSVFRRAIFFKRNRKHVLRVFSELYRTTSGKREL